MKAKFKFTNRILSLVLALVMVVGLLPMSTYAVAYNTYDVSGRTQSGNNDSFIRYGLTDDAAGSLSVVDNETSVQLNLTLNDGWYLEKWDTWFNGAYDKAIVSDPAYNESNPNFDDRYTFFNTSQTKLPTNANYITVRLLSALYGDFRVSAVVRPILNVNADDGVNYLVSTDNPISVGSAVAVEYGKNASVAYFVDDKHVITGISANYGTQYADNGSVVTVSSIVRPATVNISTRLKQQMVNFNANGGNGTMAAQTFEHSVAQGLTANAFTKNGYTFAGWNTKADNSGTSYANMASISFTPANDGDSITLYAQWTQCSDHNWEDGKCTKCGALCSHFGGNATCTEQATCEICGEQYGDLAKHNVVYNASQNRIVETCTAGCGHTATATLVQDTNIPTVYTGSAIEALKVDYSDNWQSGQLDIGYSNNINVGTAKGTLTLGDVTIEKTFGINPKEISFSWHGNNFMAYTGHLVLPRVSISGLADGDSCEANVSVVETVDGAGINPGKWTAKIAGLTNKNYKLPENKPLEVKYTIYANQNAPAVFGVDETIKGKNDGYISGLTTEMEYATEPTYINSAYTKVTDPYQIFAPGTYYVRYAAKDYYYSSKYTEVTIAQGRALTVTLPSENEQIGYTITADKTALSYGDSVSITIKYKDGYSRSEKFAVYSNGVDVTDKFNFANDTLTLTNVKEDIEITLANGSFADITAPTAEITLGTNKWNSFLNEITFGLFFNKTQTVTINASDNGSGVDKIYYHLSSEQLSEDDINIITDWKEYNNAFNINPDNKYIIYAKIVDKAGNVTYISSDGLVLDGTGPVVLGMENGAVYHGMNVFDVKDEMSDIASIKIDGVDTEFAPSEPAIYIMPDDKEHTVEVTDKAGNTTTYSVTVYKVYTVTFVAEGEAGSYEKPVKYGEVITIPENDIFEDTFRKPGYTLVDWKGYTQGMTMPLKNLTFTAVYTPNDYTVEFDPNGGEAIAPITVTFGEKYGRLPSSAITGLSGGDSNWYLVDKYGNLTETKITKLTKVSQPRNHTLFIKRSVLAPTVKLTLTVPGGISDSYQYYIPGASQRVLTATVGNMNTDVLDYSYKWYKDGELINGESSDVLTLDGNVADSGTYKVEVTARLKNGVNIVVTSDSATASKEQKVKILHATNTLNYDANGGNSGPQSSYTGGTSLTVSKDTPNREHSVFLGWNTKADGTGEQYNAEDIYTFENDNSNGGCTTTLYAQWKLVEYTVTYTADGKDVSTEKVEHGKDANLPAVPAKDGYIGKWDSDGKNITSDTTISAIYTAIPVVKPDEVKPQDKNGLEDTKENLKELLKDNSYTEDDKKDIQDAIDDINDALKVIENVENVENLIDDIPSTITKDDKAAINAAVDAYNALTDYEKSLVDKDAKKALDDAKAELSKLYKSTDTKSPQTSDNSLSFLWFALLLMGVASVFGFSYTNRKRKTANKK